jgi:hypothetical protein
MVMARGEVFFAYSVFDPIVGELWLEEPLGGQRAHKRGPYDASEQERGSGGPVDSSADRGDLAECFECPAVTMRGWTGRRRAWWR